MSAEKETSAVDAVLEYAQRIKKGQEQVDHWQEEIKAKFATIRNAQHSIDTEATLIKQKKREIVDLETRRVAESKRVDSLMKELNDFFVKQHLSKGGSE